MVIPNLSDIAQTKGIKNSQEYLDQYQKEWYQQQKELALKEQNIKGDKIQFIQTQQFKMS